VLHPLRHVRARDLLHRSPRLEHELGLEPLEVGEEEHVGLVAGGDRAEVREPVPRRGVQGRDDEGVLRRDPGGDGLAHHRVDVPLLRDVLRLAVVRAERDPMRAVLAQERKERVQVPRGRRLADQEPHSGAKPLSALLERVRLVIGADPGGGVRVQRLADDARGVAVDVSRGSERELLELVRVAADDAGEVHHLREAEHAPPSEEPVEVSRRQRPARALELRRGDGGRRHEEHVQR
jgi:hypothetical protein